MEEQKSRYLIIRQETLNDPKEVYVEGLRIGNWQGCELWLNHPSVSSLHVGLREIDGRFYVTDLSPSNSTTLNGRLIVFGEPEALADGDVLQIGPFFLEISQADKALGLTVSQQPGFNIADAQTRPDTPPVVRQASATETRPASPEVAHSLELFWAKRTRTKTAPDTPLHPQRQPRPAGKARFYWESTSDLVRPWPVSTFIWSSIIVGALLWAATEWYPSAFSPRPISEVHTRTTLAFAPEMARHTNAGSCMTCHNQQASINDNCASCHQAAGFSSTITLAHRTSDIKCITCHAEHRGIDFSPREAALKMCADCHTDGRVSNGVQMKTPHPATEFGYPVVGGQWVWKGLDDEELALKPEVGKLRRSTDTEQQWRNKQFHALHLYRVRSIASIEGIRDEDAGDNTRVISCSSCHRSFIPVDRQTPRTTCLRCHNEQIFEPASRSARSAGKISCTSCHVQHIHDTHWRPALFADAPLPPNWHESVTAK